MQVYISMHSELPTIGAAWGYSWAREQGRNARHA